MKVVNQLLGAMMVMLLLVSCGDDQTDVTVQKASAANPNVSGGKATYTANKTFDNGGRKVVPDSWNEIVINAGVTLTGNFFIPASRSSGALTIRGLNRNTSILRGNGTPAKGHVSGDHKEWSAVCNKSDVRVTVKKLTSINPRHFHILGVGKDAKMIAASVTLTSTTTNDDGFGGGTGSVIKNSIVNVTDAGIKIHSKNQKITNVTLYHNRMGAPIHLGSMDNGNPLSKVTITGLHVIQNSSNGNYHRGVFTWPGDTDPWTQEAVRKIVVSGFSLTQAPGCPASTYFWMFGGPAAQQTGGDTRFVGDEGIVKVYGQNLVTVSPYNQVRYFDSRSDDARLIHIP